MNQPDRRDFLKHMGCLASVSMLGASPAQASHPTAPSTEATAVLVDLTLCIGCRLCEHACREANGFDAGPVESYDDQSVMAEMRRPSPDCYTTINEYKPAGVDKPVYVKSNCLHCQQPACVSACIVGALRKDPDGPVVYDAWKCIGCRYCMVACPFQIPAYDYHDPLTPEVRKCTLCHEKLEEGQRPACVAACPRETMVTGSRSELLALARARIAQHPDKYVDHIYGEHEVGGTTWLYLSPVPFEELGFPTLPDEAPSALTEKIQHSIFRYGIPPLVLFSVLGGVMYATRDREPLEAPVLTDEAEGVARLAVEEAPPLPSPSVVEHEPADHHHHTPMPLKHRFLTPGVSVILGIAILGWFFLIRRFVLGLGETTNLDQQYPWGLWIGVDVESGVGLAAAGFTTAFLAEVLNRKRYHALARPALLRALMGYTFAVVGLQADLGRFYNVWHPLFMWQGNSVLFEVGMCVTCYLNVLYLEFAPIVCERLTQQGRFPRLVRAAMWLNGKLSRVMFLLIIAGCVLSCMHQSALGTLLVIAPTKLHPLWWTPWLPLQFLLSAFSVGFPMVIFEALLVARSFKLKPAMEILTPLARIVPFTLGVYLIAKIADMIWRGSYTHLLEGSLQSLCWVLEVLVGVVAPLILFSRKSVRSSPRHLMIAAGLVVGGVLFNRINVFLVGYRPPYASHPYIPSIGELGITIGLIATLVLCYRAAVTWLPIVSQPKEAAAA